MSTLKTENSNTIYISNLNYKSDRNGLKTMCMPFGKVVRIKIITEPESGQSRGMAFVEMGSPAEAKKAIAGLDGKVFSGRTVKAKSALPMAGFESKIKSEKAKKDEERELRFEEVQLEKKARREARRNSNPLVMKYVTAKKKS